MDAGLSDGNEPRRWYVVRYDNCGVPGRQPNMRGTTNHRFTAEEIADLETVDGSNPVGAVSRAEAPDRTALSSFLSLRAIYRGLDPDARYRLDVRYGAPAGEPRLQSLRANGRVVHAPRELPVGRTDLSSYLLDPGPASDGTLRLAFQAHPRHDLSDDPQVAAAPAIVSEVTLLADRPPNAWTFDAATIPGAGVAVCVQAVPYLEPIVGASVEVVIGETHATASTDGRGEACVVAPALRTAVTRATPITVRVTHDGETASTTLTCDDVFCSTWPTLTPLSVGRATEPAVIVDLDGTWRFCPAPAADCVSPYLDDSDWSTIAVPGQWVQQGFDVGRGVAACYRRDFTIDRRPGHRYKLRFDAAYAHAEVFCNGQRLGEHEGGFTPFEFDVTDTLREASVAAAGPSRNSLAVLVKSDSISDQISAASGYAAHALGGLSRSVRLFEVPIVHFARLHVEGAFGAGVEASSVHVTGRVVGLDTGMPANVTLSVKDAEGAIVAEAETVVSDGIVDCVVAVRRAQPWTAESPTLYRVCAELSSGGGAVCRAERTLGFRSVEVKARSLLVNGRPIRLRGVERHEQDPLRGRSTTPDIWRTDVTLMKEANINNVFTCHYPPAEGFLDLCDAEGLWVIDESSTVWVSDAADDDGAFLAVAGPILEMIERDSSHPSVIVWMLGDECMWGRNFWRLVVWLRLQGLSRPLMFSFDIGGASSLDIASRHYPPLDFRDAIHGVDRPVTFDQYCHVNCYNRRELVTDPGVRDWWGIAIEAMWDAMYADARVLGGQIWAWSDDVFPMSPTRAVGYGEWGLVDAWRRPKPEWWHVKMAYAPVKVRTSRLEIGVAGPHRIELENRYDFTDLDQITARWDHGGDAGVVRCHGEPRGRGWVDLPLQRPLAAGDVVRVSFHDKVGRMVTEVALTGVDSAGNDPAGASVDPPSLTEQTGGHVVEEQSIAEEQGVVVEEQSRAHVDEPNLPEFDAWVARGGDVVWTFVRSSGEIHRGRFGRLDVVCAGPELMVLPATATHVVGPHHRLDIRPFNETCHDKVVRDVTVQQRDDAFVIRTDIVYREAAGTIVSHIFADGTVRFDYDFTATVPVEPRQIGLVFDVLPMFDTIYWQRAAQWSTYPGEHIGRPVGHANARATSGGLSWSTLANSLGTNDFRATRVDVTSLGLAGIDGVGLEVEPVGRTHARAWLDGDVVRLLVASYSSGGSEPFLSRADHTTQIRRVLHEGDRFGGTVRLRLGQLRLDSRECDR